MEVSERKNDTAVILHLYYADLWREVQDYVSHIADGYDLYVSIPEGCDDSAMEEIRALEPQAVICRLPNKGRDIAPFFQILNSVIPLGYKQICKLHTKKSLHIFGGHQWRTRLYEELLGSKAVVEGIISTFDARPEIGLIGPASYLYDFHSCNALNKERVDWLTKKLDVDTNGINLNFFAGAMFWFRPEALAPLVKLDVKLDDFESEAGQVDGTLAHAFERIFLLSTAMAGYCSFTTNDTQNQERLGGGDPWYFPPARKCHKTRLLRSAKARKFVAWVRYWIGQFRSR